MRATHTLLSALAATCLLAGCGPASQSEAERQQAAEDYAASFGIDADVSTNADGSERIEVRGAAGGVSGANLALPDGFPNDIAIYPGLNISSTNAVGPAIMLQGQAPDNIDTVAAFYAEQMVSQGWTAGAGQQAGPTMRMLQFTKAGRTAGINIFQSGPGTTVQITVTGT